MVLSFRWRIVVHGGIDGYSRIPVYIHASNNNRADTVLQLFVAAVEEFGFSQFGFKTFSHTGYFDFNLLSRHSVIWVILNDGVFGVEICYACGICIGNELFWFGDYV